MRARVLRPFAYSEDGTRTKPLAAGLEFDCRDDIAPGLVAARLIEPVDTADKVDREPIETGPAVEIEREPPRHLTFPGRIPPPRRKGR